MIEYVANRPTLVIKTNTPMLKTLIIRAETESGQKIDIDLRVKVCGDENLGLNAGFPNYKVYGLETGKHQW